MSFNLADLFERVAAAVPERDALVHGSRRLSYAALDRRADMMAAALAHAGVSRGDRVAVGLRNRPEYLEAMLGAFKIRAVPVNVNYRYQRSELRHVLADSAARVLVHEPEMSGLVADVAAGLPTLEHTVERGDDLERWLEAPGEPPPEVERSGDDLYVLYTGGTTGAPKGVVWRHVDIFYAAMGGGARGGDPITRPEELVERLDDTPQRVLPASPLMHGTAHWFSFLTLFGGGTVVLSPDATFDPSRLLDLLDAETVSYLVVVGDAVAAPLADTLAAQPDRWDLNALTVVLSGGATLSAPVRRQLLDQLPWVVVVDSYGTSETGGQASAVHSPGARDTGGTQIFEPRAHTAVLGPDLRPVEPGSGTVGRIARTGHIPVGYHGDPDATARAFPVVDGRRWAVTGDQALLAADGRIVLLGRGASTINSGGEKIHPEEVEAVLRDHPDVYDAVVVGVPDLRWGERVAAVVAPRGGRDVHPAELAEHCRGELAGFKTPRTVVLVDAVRRLESGKPDYPWARGVAEEAPAPSTTDPHRSGSYK